MPSTKRDYTTEDLPHPPTHNDRLVARTAGVPVPEPTDPNDPVFTTTITDDDHDTVRVTALRSGEHVLTTYNSRNLKFGPTVVLDERSRKDLIVALGGSPR